MPEFFEFALMVLSSGWKKNAYSTRGNLSLSLTFSRFYSEKLLSEIEVRKKAEELQDFIKDVIRYFRDWKSLKPKQSFIAQLNSYAIPLK